MSYEYKIGLKLSDGNIATHRVWVDYDSVAWTWADNMARALGADVWAVELIA